MKNEESHSNKGIKILGLPSYRILIVALLRHIVLLFFWGNQISWLRAVFNQTKAVVYDKTLKVPPFIRSNLSC